MFREVSSVQGCPYREVPTFLNMLYTQATLHLSKVKENNTGKGQSPVEALQPNGPPAHHVVRHREQAE